jgi:hypothetical protein
MMTDDETRDLLMQLADSTPPPPDWDSDLVRRSAQRRHRRGGGVLAVAAAMVAVVAGGVALATTGDPNGHPKGLAQASATATPSATFPPGVAMPCAPPRVAVRVANGSSSLGQAVSMVELINESSRSCSVSGYPAILFTTSPGHEEPLTIAKMQASFARGLFGVTAEKQPLLTAPGDHVQFYLFSLTHADPRAPGCSSVNSVWHIRLGPGQPPVSVGPYALPACEYTTVSVSPYTTYVKPGFSRGLTAATSSPRRAPIATCDRANLRLGAPLTGPAGGTVYQNIAIRNLGAHACEIRTVSAWYVDAAGRRIGALAEKAAPLAGPVTILPNALGHVIVGFGNPSNYRPSACRAREAQQIEIVFAGTGHFAVQVAESLCSLPRDPPNVRLYGSGGTGDHAN